MARKNPGSEDERNGSTGEAIALDTLHMSIAFYVIKALHMKRLRFVEISPFRDNSSGLR